MAGYNRGISEDIDEQVFMLVRDLKCRFPDLISAITWAFVRRSPRATQESLSARICSSAPSSLSITA